MAKRDFGVNLPVSSRSSFTGEAEIDFGVLKDIALSADRNGFKTIGIHDHLLNPQGSSPGGDEMPRMFGYGVVEAWTTLSALSTITSRVRLTNVVLCNLFRHPAVVAKMVSTLDHISGGRVDLALGAGWLKGEGLAYGIPWKPYKTRLEMLRESVQLIKKMWTEDEVNFTGAHYKIEKGILTPKPVQKPHPPIVIGGASENVMRLVVEEADGWDVDTGICNFETFQQKHAQLQDLCREAGRDPKSIRISTSATAVLADSVPEAKKVAAAWAQRIGSDPQAFVSSKTVFLGTAEDIVGAADAWFEAGVDQLNFLMPHDAKYAETLCGEIAKLSR